MKTIITSGAPFTDIDALACGIAYKDYLKAKKIKSDVVFPGEFNESISKTIRGWKLECETDLAGPETNFEFIIVDMSDPKVLPRFVNIDRVTNVYDHRKGFENLWKGNTNVEIEPVGACATLIWEKIQSEGLVSKISKVSCNLLYTAIFSNTLNFNSSVTTDRDRKAFAQLQSLVDLDSKWISQYYSEVELSVFEKPEQAIIKDTKILNFPNLNLKIAIGQIELWDSKNFVAQHEASITQALKKFNVDDWFLTSPSISEGKNYIYTQSSKVSKLLEQYIGVQFKGNWGETNKLWLRKEILAKLLTV